jgi:hypothetical protein
MMPPGPPMRFVPVVTAGPPARAGRPVLMFVAIILIFVLGIGGGLLSIGIKKGGFLQTSDVGELSQFADMQSRLRPLNICEAEYGRRTRSGARTSTEYLHIKPCETESSYETVLLKVDPAVEKTGAIFKLERGGMTEKFKLVVDKDEVPFPSLLEAVEACTKLMETDFQKKLETERADKRKYDKQVSKAQQAEQQRKATAKETYPSK